jgi:hypothetical protein
MEAGNGQDQRRQRSQYPSSTAPSSSTTATHAAIRPALRETKTAPAKLPKTTTTKSAAKKPAPARNFGRFFKAAQVLDAVLPEHLKVGADLADEMGMGNSDNDNDDNDHDNSRSHGPSSADSKQLAKLAAGGVKVKVKRAKKSVYRPGEVGSSDEDEYYDEKMPASSADDISAMKERTFTSDDKKGGIQVSEKEVKPKPLKKRPSKGRQLQRRTSRLAQGVAWSIAFFFPLLFMSMS